MNHPLRTRPLVSLSLAFLATLAACSSENMDAVDPGGTNDAGGGANDGGFARSDAQGQDGGACASVSSEASLAPTNLVIAFNRGNTMGGGGRCFQCGSGPSTYGVTCLNLVPVIQASSPYTCWREQQNFSSQIGTGALTANDPFSGNQFNYQPCPQGVVEGTPALMCYGTNGCTRTHYFESSAKFRPIGEAIKGFLASPGSAGFNASLTFFPKMESALGTCKTPEECYGTPDVAATALPSAAFGAKIDATDATSTYNGAARTPLQGIYAYARALQRAKPGERSAVILVTDGNPSGCISGENQQELAKYVESVASDPSDPIRTYVVGIGDQQTTLNAVASAGKTGQALFVPLSNPAAATQAMQNALADIKAKAVSCTLGIPKAPDGKEFDRTKVNVVVKVGGKDTTVPYDKDCLGTSGWRYDDAANPKSIQLCANSCEQVRADTQGKLSIAFGCGTVGNLF